MSQSPNFAILGALLAYVLVQFAIGAWVSRRIASEKDYIIAGRSLGAPLVAFSVFATWFGAEAIQVSAGEIYENGLSGALNDPFGYGVAVILVALILAGPLWRRNVVTFADMIRERYSAGVEKLFVLVLVPGSVFWAAAQICAFGQILSSSSGLDVGTTILIAAVLVGVYSVVGGLLADAITDVFQGLVVILGLVVLTVYIASQLGGFAASIDSIRPDRLSFSLARGDEGPLGRIDKLAVTIFGSLVSVELISRFLGASSARAAYIGTAAGGALYLVVGLLPIYLGLVGPNLIPSLAEPEQIIPKLAEGFMPGVAFAIFLGALVSAILSVVHAALHAPAAQLSHNILTKLTTRELSPRQKLWSVRITVLALSVVAYGLALSVDHIRDLVEIASAVGSAGAFVVVAFGLFTSFGGPRSALAALLVGVLVWLIGKFVYGLAAPYLTGLLSAFSIYVIVAAFERRSHSIQ